MKQNFLLPIGVAALFLAFTACTDDISEVQSSELKQIVMTAFDFETETGSRTNFKITSAGAEFSWAANDTVGIFPNEGAQAYFPMTSGAGTKSANFTGGGWALKDASTYAAYYPFIGNFYLNKNAIPVDYTGQVQIGDASTAHLGAYDFMAAAPSTPKNGNVNFAFKHLGALVQLKLTVPEATTLNSVTLTTENNDFSAKGTVDIMASSLDITPVTSTNEITLEVKDITTTEVNQVVTLYMMIPPCTLAGKSLAVTANDNNGNIYLATLSGKDLVAGKAYAFEATANVSDSVTDVILSSAGTLLDAIGGYDKLRKVEKLKITGEINGDDVYEIRRMSNLKYLNLKDAHIVEGGRAYYDSYTTKMGVIGNDMFKELKSLEEIILPDSTVEIGFAAFYLCKIKSLTMFEGVETIGNLAFVDNEFTSVVLPQSLKTISYSAFNGAKLENIVIPPNVESIGQYAFACYTLKSVTIKARPETLTNISDNAFRDSYETATLYIPKGTKEAYCKTELGRFVNIVEE